MLVLGSLRLSSPFIELSSVETCRRRVIHGRNETREREREKERERGSERERERQKERERGRSVCTFLLDVPVQVDLEAPTGLLAARMWLCPFLFVSRISFTLRSCPAAPAELKPPTRRAVFGGRFLGFRGAALTAVQVPWSGSG